MSAELDAFFADSTWQLPARINGWEVVRDGDLVYFSLSAKDGEKYRVRFGCDGYPGRAPSVVFVNQQGDKSDPRAWPAGDGQFQQVVKPPSHCFLCMPLTREGLEHHRDWASNPATSPWTSKSTLLDLFNYLHRLLNGGQYQRRGP